MKERCKAFWMRHNELCSWLLVAVTLLLAYALCSVVMNYSKIDNDAPIVFVMAVVIICRLTRKLRYGIVASLLSSVAINYFFTFPYHYFTLAIAGYPIDFICIMCVSVLITTLTNQAREQAERAVRHEQATIELYRRNQKLEEKRAAAELAAEKEKMHGNLLRAVSHDLRTPLTAVAGASSVLMQDDGRLSLQERKKLAAGIHDEALWLSQMVENLLSVTRFQNGGSVRLKEREELVEEVLEESIAKFRRRFPDQQVEVYSPEEILFVPMDVMLIEQVLVNLLENAVRHSGVKEKIEVTAYREGDNVCFAVRDHGKGIAPNILPELFSGAIHQSDCTRGMGIGLSVCMSIILAHNGTLKAYNHPEGGAEFLFALPMEVTEEQQAEDASIQEEKNP